MICSVAQANADCKNCPYFEKEECSSKLMQEAKEAIESLEADRKERDELSKAYQALEYLYGELRKAKHALGHAENRKGVTQEELSNLIRKIENIDWIICLVQQYGYEKE